MANIILNSEKQKVIPLMSGQDTVTILIQYTTGSPSHGNQTKEERKRIQMGKEVNLSLFADDIILRRHQGTTRAH